MYEYMDWVISQEANRQLVFRFYPKRSSCHLFNMDAPKTWDNVYKEYFYYAILEHYRIYGTDKWETEVVYDAGCDECSLLNEVGERCRLLKTGQEVFTKENGDKVLLLDKPIMPMGQGIEWEIHKRMCWGGWDDDEELIPVYRFTMFNCSNCGYRFEIIGNKEVGLFGDFLVRCCDYMLENGCPI